MAAVVPLPPPPPPLAQLAGPAAANKDRSPAAGCSMAPALSFVAVGSETGCSLRWSLLHRWSADRDSCRRPACCCQRLSAVAVLGGVGGVGVSAMSSSRRRVGSVRRGELRPSGGRRPVVAGFYGPAIRAGIAARVVAGSPGSDRTRRGRPSRHLQVRWPLSGTMNSPTRWPIAVLRRPVSVRSASLQSSRLAEQGRTELS